MSRFDLPRPVELTKYWPKEHTVKAYFHRWTENMEREVGAVVEYEDGTVDEWWNPRGVRFLDVDK